MAAFSSLRLSTSAYNKHKKSEGGSSSNDYLLESGTGVLNITGYDEEARTVIEQSVEDGEDWLDVPFNISDSVAWVLMRIQDELRIPTQHWSIAVEGELLNGWYTTLRALPAFWGSERVDAVLVPADQVKQWKKEQSKKSQNKANWKFLQPGSTKSSNEGKQAAAIYHLIRYTASTSSVWARYMAQRKAADKQLVRVLREQECDECESLLQQIKHGVGNILSDIELDRTQILSVVDGVIPLNMDVDDEDGDGCGLTEAKVYTRTYSPTKPSAVDVYFTWKSHAGYDSVSLTSEVLYRICDPISTDKLDIPDKRIKAATGGWKRLLSMSMKPGGRSRGGERSYNATWSVKPTDVDKIHSTLFAPSIGIDKLQTMRIVLASVGILIRVARKAGEEDEGNPDGLGKISWWDHHEWVATQLRKACGVSLKRDAPKKTKKPKEKKWTFEDEIPVWVGKPEPIPRDYSDSDSDDSRDSY